MTEDASAITDIAHCLAFRAVRSERLAHRPAPPADTPLFVVGPIEPGFLVEFEAVAVVPRA